MAVAANIGTPGGRKARNSCIHAYEGRKSEVRTPTLMKKIQ